MFFAKITRAYTWIMQLPRPLLRMKLTTLLLTMAIMQVGGTVLGQSVNINSRNAPLKKVLQEIRLQTGYVFFYDAKDVQNITVNVTLKNATVEEALTACLKDLPFSYKIVNKNIVISRREATKSSELVALPHNISGTVVDENGKPAIGVTVILKGTKVTTITDENGRFSIKSDTEKSLLVFTSINLETREQLNIGAQPMYVVLKVKNNQLAEVVVNTGYETLTKERSTGSVATVSSKQLEQRYNPNLLDQIEGRVPGLITYATGLNGSNASTVRSVTIRGVGTIRANLSALLVIDGLPIEGTIDDVNPYDVESISVLKDAAAASLYGARASNGVIVITTKKAKMGRTLVEVSTDVTTRQKPDYSYLHYMSASQQVDFESKFFDSYFNSGRLADPVGTMAAYIDVYNFPTSPVSYLYYQAKKGAITNDQLNAELADYRKNDFLKQYKDHALTNELMQQYNVAIRSGGTKYQSSLVVNFRTSNRGIVYNRSNNFNLFYKGSYNVSRWLDINFGVNTVYNKDKSQFSTAATNPFDVPAYTQLLDEHGNRVQYTLSDVNANNTFLKNTPGFAPLNFNHLDELARDFSYTKQLNSRMYIHANIKLTNDFKLSSQFQYEDLRSDINSYSEPESYTMRLLTDIFTPVSATGTYTSLIPAGGRLATKSSRGNDYTFRNQLNFNHTYAGKHAISMIAGMEFRQTFQRTQNALYLGYDDQLLTNQTATTNFAAIATAAVNNTLSAYSYYGNMNGAYSLYFNGASSISETVHRYSSGYANLTYTYDNRYNLFGSIRKDVADLFGADANQKGRPFYSVGMGWNVNNEVFMESFKAVDFLKLRVTYGLTGNTDYSTTKVVTASSSTNTITRQPWLIIRTPANPGLRWELTKTTNAGIDFGLFKNRLSGSVDLYYKASNDLVAEKLLDATEGFTSVGINNGAAVNKGVEMSLNYIWVKPVSKDGFGFNTSYTLTRNSNKITRADNVYNSSAFLMVSPSGGRAYQQGRPVNSLYSYQYAGINANGDPEWITASGKTSAGVTNASDLVFSGTLDPKVTMSLIPELTFKRISLSALFVYFGGHVMRADQPVIVPGIRSETPVIGVTAIPDYVLDAWTPEHTNTLVPGIGKDFPNSQLTNSYYSAQLAFADKFVQPADFIKMRSVTLSYMLPQLWVKRIAAGSVRVRFQANNAWTLWTKNKIGIDPEANNAWQGNYVATGRYLRAQPAFVFSANVNF